MVAKLYYIASVIYKSYKRRNLDIPHFRAIGSLVGLFFLHLCQIVIVFKFNWLIPWSSSDSKGVQWIKGAAFFLILIFVFSLVFRKDKLEAVNIPENELTKSSRYLLIYAIGSFLLLFGLLIWTGIKTGKIK
jgi:hypothetical protein